MMTKPIFVLVLSFLLFHQDPVAQDLPVIPRTYKIALFAPLYLDSVFNGPKLSNEKSIPKFIQPSLEFIQGAQIALDSFDINNYHLEAFVYDTRSNTENLNYLFQNHVLDSINLIIGSVKDKDYKQLADFASKKSIPFISATYPNDGGVTSNPFVAIVNSTLKAHVEGIYSYLLENHGTEKIYLCRKKGSQEDKIASYFKLLNEQEGKPLLNIQTINFDSTISTGYFKTKLDSLSASVIIGGSFDEDFAKNLSNAVFTVFKKNYKVTLIGMPAWDGFKTFTRKDVYKDFPVHFTTPYYNSKSDKNFSLLTTEYMRRFKSKPTDMACKGFEIVQYFVNVLLHYPDSFMSHLNEKSYRVFSEYNFRPVYPKKKISTPDYFENKHLYVMKIFNGTISREW